MQSPEASVRTLYDLKKLGIRISLDDFGTGHSSLSYLKRFPLDTLKVDRAFINDVCLDEENAAIVRAIIGLGHNLGLKLVAEGVETAGQLQFLRTEGCDLIQGFLMSRAIPAAAFAALIRGSTTVRGTSDVDLRETAGAG